MFSGAVAFNQPLSHWDVRQVSNMDGMFRLTAAFN
jgi:surface protein